MCRWFEDRFGERQALATGLVEIADIEGLCVPLAFHSTGQKLRIYLPAGWTGLMRDAAIVYLLVRVCTPRVEYVGRWREVLGGVVGAAVGGLAACLVAALLLVG